MGKCRLFPNFADKNKEQNREFKKNSKNMKKITYNHGRVSRSWLHVFGFAAIMMISAALTSCEKDDYYDYNSRGWNNNETPSTDKSNSGDEGLSDVEFVSKALRGTMWQGNLGLVIRHEGQAYTCYMTTWKFYTDNTGGEIDRYGEGENEQFTDRFEWMVTSNQDKECILMIRYTGDDNYTPFYLSSIDTEKNVLKGTFSNGVEFTMTKLSTPAQDRAAYGTTREKTPLKDMKLEHIFINNM